jgi:hypothetical protein
MNIRLLGLGLALIMIATMTSASAVTSDDRTGYNGTYAGDLYSTLAQLNHTNIDLLHPVCAFQLGEIGPMQRNPSFQTATSVSPAIRRRLLSTRQRASSFGRIPTQVQAHLGRGMLLNPDSGLSQFDGHSNKPVEDELGGIQCQPNDNSTRGNTRSKRFV